MSLPSSAQVHATALVSPEAELAPDVQVGPFTIIKGRVKIGPGCVIGPRAHLIGPLTMGKNNQVFGNAILGERPQHFGYNDEPTGVEIGDDNTFRENVTVHRATKEAWQTRIGNGNYFMAGSHVAHDCQVGNRCIFVNNSLLGGHVHVGDNVFLSGNSAVHQFCRVGRLAFLGGTSACTKDIPPFILQQQYNTVCGVNVVGMRRARLGAEAINTMRKVFHVVYLQGLSLPNALAAIDRDFGQVPVVREFIEFVRESKRGINGTVVREVADIAA